MIVLQSLTGEVLSLGIRNVTPLYYESIKIKNKLLDGSCHVQTVGDPIKYKDFIALADGDQTEMLNHMEAVGEPLKLIEGSKYYIGMIDAQIKWDRKSGWYADKKWERHQGQIKMNIQSEGVV